jgi:hypothetical protein
MKTANIILALSLALLGAFVTSSAQGQIVSDDFNKPALNTNLWTWSDPQGDDTDSISGYGTTDVVLSVSVSGNEDQDQWAQPSQNCATLLQNAPNTDFEVTAKWETVPGVDNGEYGFLVYDPTGTNFLRFDVQTVSGALDGFMGIINQGTGAYLPGANWPSPIGGLVQPTDGTDNGTAYMRLKRQGDLWTYSLSSNGVDWVTFLQPITQAWTVAKVGPYFGGQGITYNLDWFFNDASPILNEDGNPLAKPTIVDQPASMTNLQGYATQISAAADDGGLAGLSLSYQWWSETNGVYVPLADGGQISGSGTPTLTISNLVFADATNYYVVVTNVSGAVTSSVANVTVLLRESSPIVSDDFNEPALNTNLWTWSDPQGDDTYSISGYGTADVVLSVSVSENENHDAWVSNNCATLLQNAPNTDFEVTAKWETVPGADNGEYGFLVYDPTGTNFLRFNVQGNEGGLSGYLIIIQNGNGNTLCANGFAQAVSLVPPTDGTDNGTAYMRLKRQGDLWTYSLSSNGVDWVTVYQPVTQAWPVAYVGPYFGGQGITYALDWFFNDASPIAYEDGNHPLPPIIVDSPASGTNLLGQNQQFSATADDGLAGLLGLHYQWDIESSGVYVPLADGGQFSGSGTPTLTISNLVFANATNYYVVVTNNWGAVTSSVASLTILPITGALIGSGATAASSYNLTTLGALDWAHWNGTFIDKASGGGLISDVTQIGAGTYGTYSDPSRNITWSDGTPIPSGINDNNYIWCNGASDSGWTFTVPADTTNRTLHVLCGGPSGSSVNITAQLSDFSAPAYTDTTIATGALFTKEYMFTYKAGSASQTLTITVTHINSGGPSCDLIAAWLTPAGFAPPTVAMTGPADGTLFTVPAKVILTADASSTNSTIAEVDFYADTTNLIGTATSEPYSFTWNITNTGIYTVTATATDSSGATGYATDPITLLVGGPGLLPVSDDFDEPALNTNLWTWINPVGDCSYSTIGYGSTDVVLAVSCPAGAGHDPWTDNTAAQIMQNVPDEDFEVTAKFESIPALLNQEEGFLVLDPTGANFLRFNIQVQPTLAGFMLIINNGVGNTLAGGTYALPISSLAIPAGGGNNGTAFLRLRRQGDTWTFLISPDGVAWETVYHPVQQAWTMAQLGLYVGDGGTGYTAAIDYFFNDLAPIANEDGQAPTQPRPSLVITRSGNNIVISWPTSAAGYSLASTPSISGSITWSPDTTAVVVAGGQNTVTESIGSGAKFYRLTK